jgi:hypothetical protein
MADTKRSSNQIVLLFAIIGFAISHIRLGIFTNDTRTKATPVQDSRFRFRRVCPICCTRPPLLRRSRHDSHSIQLATQRKTR